MNKSQLARDLGISRQMLYKHASKGMPTHSLIAAQEWRGNMFNVEVTQTKAWRIDGNSGKKREAPQVTARDFDKLQDVDIDSVLNYGGVGSRLTHAETLADTVPEIWFEQIGRFGSVLKSHGIKITAEQLCKIQAALLITYMKAVAEHLGKDVDDITFYVPPVFRAKPGNKIHLALIKRLNQILDTEPTH